MHEKKIRGGGWRWMLAAVLVALLAGCKDDETRTAANPPPPGGNAPPSSPAPEPLPQARAATLEWTVPTTATDGSTLDNLAGFRIHYGQSVLSLDTVIEIRNPSISSYVVEGLAPGTYYFAVTAFTSTDHESERSNAGLKEVI